MIFVITVFCINLAIVATFLALSVPHFLKDDFYVAEGDFECPEFLKNNSHRIKRAIFMSIISGFILYTILLFMEYLVYLGRAL